MSLSKETKIMSGEVQITLRMLPGLDTVNVILTRRTSKGGTNRVEVDIDTATAREFSSTLHGLAHTIDERIRTEDMIEIKTILKEFDGKNKELAQGAY